MSKSLINFLSEVSSDRSGPLTRSVADVVPSASGFIEQEPPHWAIEFHIPIAADDLVEYLLQNADLEPGTVKALRSAVDDIVQALRNEAAELNHRFDSLYQAIDPDRETQRPAQLQPPAGQDAAATAEAGDLQVKATIQLCREVLHQAGFRQVDRSEIEACVGVASQWGVPLHVDFHRFKQLVVYCRGDIIGNRVRRRLRSLYRLETVEVAVYQRMVVMFQLHEDVTGDEDLFATALHLRMFKNIPKQDIDMLLPCSRVRFTWIDRLKIFLPTVGGALMSARKLVNTLLIVAVLTLKSTLVLVGLAFALIGYLVRSVLGYFQTKNRYLLHLTRNLYFQKLDTNAGVGYRVIRQAYAQALTETVLAYYGLLSAQEPLSERKWQRRCERIVREAITLEVEVAITRAASRLESLRLVQRNPQGRWEPVAPAGETAASRQPA